MSKSIFLSIGLLLFSNYVGSQEIIKLWSEEIPNRQESKEIETQEKGDILWIENIQEPTLEVYLPLTRTATGKAMVIFPGGGYQGLAYDVEGVEFAKWLNSKGIAAFVVKYRMPISESVIEGHKVPMQDAERAIRLVRHNAEKWNVLKDQIGIMGFSAGGHLASTVGTRYDEDFLEGPINSLSARPDFMILVYPVITMQSTYTHLGSRNNLLGENPEQSMIDSYSSEFNVDENTPPTFLIHATDDKVVSVMNSILFYKALVEYGIYSEMHIYPEGGHGFGHAIGFGHLSTWTDRLHEWIESLE